MMAGAGRTRQSFQQQQISARSQPQQHHAASTNALEQRQGSVQHQQQQQQQQRTHSGGVRDSGTINTTAISDSVFTTVSHPTQHAHPLRQDPSSFDDTFTNYQFINSPGTGLASISLQQQSSNPQQQNVGYNLSNGTTFTTQSFNGQNEHIAGVLGYQTNPINGGQTSDGARHRGGSNAFTSGQGTQTGVMTSQHENGSYPINLPHPVVRFSNSHSDPPLNTQDRSVEALQEQDNRDDAAQADSGEATGEKRLVPNPPNLLMWREKLFNVDTTPLVLSEDEYLTYFPHVDNVYSHRSTQKYKRKPFVSHYWDCRLKGRPSGTPKSDDPNKKKRKRQARERDLCDVKIKVTEHFAMTDPRRANLTASDNGIESVSGDIEENGLTVILEDGPDSSNTFGMLEVSNRPPKTHPGANGKRWFSIQRVNGTTTTGAGADREQDPGIASLAGSGPEFGHKHSLEESDRIKKNSVQRMMLIQEKGRKKSGRSTDDSELAQISSLNRPVYLANGPARQTVLAHKGQSPIRMKFYGNSFCPFSNRVWIALELKKLPYQYIELLPSQVRGLKPMPPDMLEGNPGGNTPCIRHGKWTIWESGIIMEYLEDIEENHNLFPQDNAQLKAHCRLWADHINRKILPAFYTLLLTPMPGSPADILSRENNHNDGPNNISLLAEKHSTLVNTLQDAITALVNASHAIGPFFMGIEIGFVDVVFAPWIIRLTRVLSHFGKFPRPEVGTRLQQWVEAIEANEDVRRTISEEAAYQDIYAVAAGQSGIIEHSRTMVEAEYAIENARRIISQYGFGLGGDFWGQI